MKLTKRKGFNFFRSYFDVYNELETDKDKVAFIDALLDRQFLGIKPDGLKGMSKFAYVSQVNSIDTQVKGYEDRVKAINKDTEGYDPWQGVEKTILTPPQQEKGKGEVQEKEKVKEEKKKEVFNFRKSLLELGFKEELVTDWLKVRRTKKSTNTETALKSFLTEVEKSELTKDQILTICIERDWKGFKNDWVKNIKNERVKNSKQEKLGAKFDIEGAIARKLQRDAQIGST